MLHMVAKCKNEAPFDLKPIAAAQYKPGLGTLDADAVAGQVDAVHAPVCHEGLC